MLRKSGFTTRQLRWAHVMLTRDIDDGLIDIETGNKAIALLFGEGQYEFLDQLISTTMPHRNRLHKPTYIDQLYREYFFEDTAPTQNYHEQFEAPPSVPSETDSWIVGLPQQRNPRCSLDTSIAFSRKPLPHCGQELTLTRVQDSAQFSVVVRYVFDALDATARVGFDTELPVDAVPNVEAVYNQMLHKALISISSKKYAIN